MTAHNRHSRARQGSALFLTMALMGIGLAFTATMTGLMVHHFISQELPPADILMLRWAEERDKAKDPLMAFIFFSDAIEIAETPKQKNTAIMAMTKFLLKEDNWRPAWQRHRMAANYATVLAKQDIDGCSAVDTATVFLQLASKLRDHQALQHANRILARVRDQGKMPFDLNLLEFQVFFDLGYAAPAYASLDALKAFSAIGEQQIKALHCETRVLWRIYTNTKWFNALSSHFEGATPSEKLEKIRQQLTENANALAQSNNSQIKQESLVIIAQIAFRSKNMNQAIPALQRAAYNTSAPGRRQAAQRLLALLRQERSIEDAAAARLMMLADSHLQETALIDLDHEISATTDTARVGQLLSTLDQQLDMLKPGQAETYNILVRAARTAIGRDELDRTERYLAAAQAQASTATNPAREFEVQADLAARRGNHDAQVRYLYKLISLNTDKQLDTHARHSLLKALAKDPKATAGLVGSAIDATMRFPQDERCPEGLLITAQRLEELSLPAAAETYYRHAILLGSLHTQETGDKSPTMAQAMLGQARVLLSIERDRDADQILRTLNTHSEWAGIWPESTPLWAAIAMRQGQHKEAIRRWRQTCGPSGDALLSTLFEILVPDLTALTTQPTEHPRPAPAKPPKALMLATADAAMDQLLQSEAYERIDQLLSQMENDSYWRAQLPLEQYRIQTLTRLIAKEPAATVMAWMDRQAISEKQAPAGDTLLSADALRDWIQKTDRLSLRARAAAL